MQAPLAPQPLSPFGVNEGKGLAAGARPDDTALVLGNASCRAGGENCAEGGAGPSPVWTVLAFPCVFSQDTTSWAAPQRPSS